MAKRAAVIAILVAAFACGCGKQPEKQPNRADISRKLSTEVMLTTSDGWTIHGDYNAVGSASSAVVLLHQRNGTAADWTDLCAKLNQSGIATLAIDQRGAGRSTGTSNGDDAPWRTVEDIAAGVDCLKGKGFVPARIGLIGASYGANNALIYASMHPEIRMVVLLSPGTDYHGLHIERAAKNYAGKLLLVYSKDDTVMEGGPDTIKQASDVKPDEQIYDGDAHGVAIFNAHADAMDAITTFVAKELK